MQPLILYQFELSHFSEKIRFILDYKGLPWERRDVLYGPGQKVLERLTGQRRVPVLVDPNHDGRAVHDSTAIALYLDQRYPDLPLLPVDPDARAECLMLEDWIDHAIGEVARKVFIWEKLRVDQDFVRKTMDWNADAMTKRLLPLLGPFLMKRMMKRDGIDERTVAEARVAAHRTLDCLDRRLERAPYLTGASPTLPDFAAAGTAMLLQFPPHGYLRFPPEIAHDGVPDLQSSHRRFFEWKDGMYGKFRKKTS